MEHKEYAIGDIAYFAFAANTTAGTADDGATPLYDVRLCGAAAGAAPTASGTPTLLTHADYTPGLHEIAIDTAGYAAGEYEVFCSLTISTVNPAGYCGSFKLRAAGATVHALATSILDDTGTTLPAQISAIGSGSGAALNFAASDDNADDTVGGVSLTHVGTETGTYANTSADDTSTHVIASADVTGTQTIDWAYAFTCGAAKAASQVTWKGTLSGGVGQSDTFTFAAWNGATWDTRLVVANTSSAVQTFDIPLLAAHTTVAGLVILRITYAEADAGTLTTNLLLCKAQQSGSQIGYANGSVWVRTAGTAASVPYVNATADNPAPWANALAVASALGLSRYTVTPGTTVTLAAAFAGAVMTGRSYTLALGGQNISGSFFEGVEGLSGTGTCATAEAIFMDSHLNAVTIGEADFVRCHLMGEINQSQASVAYRYHDCTGVSTAKITFGAASQTAVVSGVSGELTIAGMTTGDTLFLDGNCTLLLDATNDGGIVHLNGAIELTNLGSGQTITKGGVTLGNWAHGGISAVITAERIVVASTTTDEPAVKLTGDGSGAGLQVVGGATTGVGLLAQGSQIAGGAGYGIHAQGGIANGEGFFAEAQGGDSNGFLMQGDGAGAGWKIEASATGAGVEIVGGSTSGDGIKITTTLGHGITATGGGSGAGILATGGATDGNGMTLTKGGAGGKDLDADEVGVVDLSSITALLGTPADTDIATDIANVATTLGSPAGADFAADIADLPTILEFEARTLAAADYTIVSDLGVVQTADHTAAIADIPTVAEFNARTVPTDAGGGMTFTAASLINAPGGGGVTPLTSEEVQAAALAAIEEYDESHSTTLGPGSSLTVGAMIGTAASAGPRTPLIVGQLFDEVRLSLRDKNKNLYPDELMVSYWNRAISECWNLLTQVGASVVMNTGTIVCDGAGQDYELPTDFRAFVINGVLPRSPITATTDYSWGKPLTQVGLHDTRISGMPSSTGSATAFTVFGSGNSQYIRFSTIPAAGEMYDFRYYPEYQRLTLGTIGNTYTPWLGLLDQLLARILEEFCREGLEFVTSKRDLWRARHEADLVALLGLRHLEELDPAPSMWRNMP